VKVPGTHVPLPEQVSPTVKISPAEHFFPFGANLNEHVPSLGLQVFFWQALSFTEVHLTALFGFNLQTGGDWLLSQ
jgi:hypothetical protein